MIQGIIVVKLLFKCTDMLVTFSFAQIKRKEQEDDVLDFSRGKSFPVCFT